MLTWLCFSDVEQHAEWTEWWKQWFDDSEASYSHDIVSYKPATPANSAVTATYTVAAAAPSSNKATTSNPMHNTSVNGHYASSAAKLIPRDIMKKLLVRIVVQKGVGYDPGNYHVWSDDGKVVVVAARGVWSQVVCCRP
jgi:hypothetical protein